MVVVAFQLENVWAEISAAVRSLEEFWPKRLLNSGWQLVSVLLRWRPGHSSLLGHSGKQATHLDDRCCEIMGGRVPLPPQDPSTQNLLDAGLGPSAAHWLGTDHLGRDTFSRLIIAANTSLVSVGSVLGVAMTIGILLGTIAGYHRGWVDDLLMRVVDVGLSVPSLIISLAVIGIVGPGYWTMVLALALAWWPMSGRISRAVAVSIMSKPHIEALRVLGASPWGIYFGHLLPGTIGSVIVYATADAGTAALAVAT